MVRLKNMLNAVSSGRSAKENAAATLDAEHRVEEVATTRSRSIETPSYSEQAVKRVSAALYSRDVNGTATTLRELHQIAQLTQPEALSALGHLQKKGCVEIAPNLDDAFASRVSLTAVAREWIETNAAEKSA